MGEMRECGAAGETTGEMREDSCGKFMREGGLNAGLREGGLKSGMSVL